MTFSHFLGRRKDTFLIAAIFVIEVILIFCAAVSFFFVVCLLMRQDKNPGLIIAGLSFLICVIFSLYNAIFLLQKFEFTKEGIKVYSGFRKKLYNWNSITEYGVFSIAITTNDIITPYLLFILSSPNEVRSNCRNLSKCFLYAKDVISIRYTDERNNQLETILGKTTKIYDWHDLHSAYEINPDREPNSPPGSPYPYYQKLEERWRNSNMGANGDI